jgi:hypothetical protein
MMSLIIASIFFTASTQIMIMQKFAQKETTTYAEDVYLARLNMSYVKDKDTLKRILIKDYRQGHRYSQDVVFYDTADDLDLIRLSGGWPVFVGDLETP